MEKARHAVKKVFRIRQNGCLYHPSSLRGGVSLTLLRSLLRHSDPAKDGNRSTLNASTCMCVDARKRCKRLDRPSREIVIWHARRSQPLANVVLIWLARSRRAFSLAREIALMAGCCCTTTLTTSFLAVFFSTDPTQ